jgi:hypothetical protein
MFSTERILIDGALLSALLGTLILTSLWINPRIWLQDYPVDIRQKVAPLAAGEKRMRSLFALAFVATFAVVPFLSTRAVVEIYREEVTFGSLFLHAFLVLNLFNLFDAVVIDWLFLGVVHPRFAFIQEAWGQRERFLDVRKGVADWLKGIVFCAVFALVIAGVVMLTMG